MAKQPLFLQVNSLNPHYQGMVDDHQERHKAYCKKWGYTYLAADLDIKSGWQVQSLILSHMESGLYSHIFWIDGDTFVADFSRDMRETLAASYFLAMTIHAYPWTANQPVFHANAGIQYWRCCDMAKLFLKQTLELQHLQDNQAAINWLLFSTPHWQTGFRALNCEWNNSFHDQPQRPIVSAYHGFLDAADRRSVMAANALNFPWETSL